MTRHFSLLIAAFFLLCTQAGAQPWMAELDVKQGERPTFKEVQAAYNRYMEGNEHVQGTEFKEFGRWEWFMRSHVNSDDVFSTRDYWNGLKERRQFSQSLDELDEANWQGAGPSTTRNSFTGGMGRLNCVAFHPTDSDIIYVGSASGGVWKTTNHGETWVPLSDDLPLLGISAIAIDYNNPDIVYIGTGDRDGTDTPSVGVLKSTDAGETWNTTSLSYDRSEGDYDLEVDELPSVNKIVIHPTNPSIVIAATNDNIYRTTDAGESWTECTNWNRINHKDLVTSPDGNYWYSSTSLPGIPTIYRSADGGVTWQEVAPIDDNGPGAYPGLARVALAVSPVNPAHVYAVANADIWSGFGGFWSSTDYGVTWTLMSTSPNILGDSIDGSGNSGMGLDIVADPDDESTVYVGGINIWKSVDSGATWSIVSYWDSDNATVPFVHGVQHSLEFNGSTFYSCNRGGLSYSTNDGASWTDISSGLVITQINRIGSFQGNPSYTLVLSGNQDNGTDLYHDGEWSAVIAGDGMECGFDLLQSNIMYAEGYYGILLKSTDAGHTWYQINNGAPTDGDWLSPLNISERNPGVLIKATTSVYKSTDYGESWVPISPMIIGGYPVQVMGVAPSNEDNIYVTRSEIPDIFVTHDGGITWGSVGAFEGVSDITVDPNDPNTVYLTLGRYTENSKIYRSTDGGMNWTNLSGDLPNIPMHCLEIHPYNPDHLYLGTDMGVFFSPDAGANWQDYSNGMPNVMVSELEIHRNSNTLLAATYGRGMWATPAMSPVAANVPRLPQAELSESGLVTLSWQVPEAGTEGLTGYTVYRNDDIITFLTEQTSITHQLSAGGSYTFVIRANYTGSVISDPSVPVLVVWNTTDVHEVDNTAVPVSFELLPAYPNPFNPTTTVTLALPEPANATITVFNVLGAEVAKLHSGHLNSGYHRFTFDASKAVSGVYFIRATVPGQLDINRKVVLLK